MEQLFVLDLQRGYRSVALLTAAALARSGGDVLIVQGDRDREAVQTALERFRPERVHAMQGTIPQDKVVRDGREPIQPLALPHEETQILPWLVEHALPSAKGVVLIPAHSPSWAIKGAALAARLGYLLWPMEEAAGLAFTAPPDLTVLAVGEAPGSLGDALQGRNWVHLSGDRAVAHYLAYHRIAVDYLVLVNSADTTPPEYTGQSLAGTWTPGLSLLAPMLASYRSALVLDARSPRPDSRAMETTVRQKVHDVGIKPNYFAILASPGAIPFIEEPNRSFGRGEDWFRDLHLRHDDDLFFDCAEGRVFALTAGKASLQLLSTKHYHRLQGNFRQKAVLAMRPHVESGVTFSIDEAVGRTQMAPLLRKAGLKPVELYDQDCTPPKIADHLRTAGLVFYGGHGHSHSWSTHGSPFYAEALPPQIAPAVVYACACSTVYPKHDRVSADGGFSHEDEVVPPAEVISVSFVERGALAYVGGLTAEDVLLNTPMYVAFMQHLVLKGESTGQAVRAARNHTMTHVAALSQKAPEALQSYLSSLANTLQQQILLGDPAFTPYPGTSAAHLPTQLSQGEGSISLSLTVPDSAWVREKTVVHLNDAGKRFHRARSLETWLPIAEDVYNWGENFTVALDRDKLSDRGIMGGYIHLTVALPPGRVPSQLKLEAAEAISDECLLCGSTQTLSDALRRFQIYTVQFQGSKPAIKMDHTNGWAYATEETPEGLRVHWLMPVLAIDDSKRRAALLRQARFTLTHVPGVKAEGRLELTHQPAGVEGAPGALEGSRGAVPADVLLSFGRVRPPKEDPTSHDPRRKKQVPQLEYVGQTLTGPGGRFSCWLPAEELAVAVGLPLPLYRHGSEAVLSYSPDTVTGLQPHQGLVSVSLTTPATGEIAGVVVDKRTGRPLSGARVRLWKGEADGDDFRRDGYVSEAKCDAQGRFEFIVPEGRYVVSALTRTDVRYFSATVGVRVYGGKTASALVALEPGVVLNGHVSYVGGYAPKSASVRVVGHHESLEKSIAVGRIRRDGGFEVLIPAARPFNLVVQTEGYRLAVDDNAGSGYVVDHGETLTVNLEVQAEE